MSDTLADLNKQAIAAARQYTGGIAWPTVALVAFTLAGVVTTLGLYAAGGLPAWAATLLIGALTYFAYTPLHEAVVQARGQAGERQCGRHDLVLATGYGGRMQFHACAVLSPHSRLRGRA